MSPCASRRRPRRAPRRGRRESSGSPPRPQWSREETRPGRGARRCRRGYRRTQATGRSRGRGRRTLPARRSSPALSQEALPQAPAALPVQPGVLDQGLEQAHSPLRVPPRVQKQCRHDPRRSQERRRVIHRGFCIVACEPVQPVEAGIVVRHGSAFPSVAGSAAGSLRTPQPEHVPTGAWQPGTGSRPAPPGNTPARCPRTAGAASGRRWGISLHRRPLFREA